MRRARRSKDRDRSMAYGGFGMRRVVEEQLHSERVQERNQIGFLLGSKTNIEAHVVKDYDICQ